MIKQPVQEIYKEYLSQSSIECLEEFSTHENVHDNSGGDPDYHNDSHDNTPGVRQMVLKKNETN